MIQRYIRRTAKVGFIFVAMAATSACMRMKSTGIVQQVQARNDEIIEVYMALPSDRLYQEAMHYEIVGSNLIRYERLLNRVRDQARKDGCEALVQVKFYKRQFGKSGGFFPAVEAVGIRYVE